MARVVGVTAGGARAQAADAAHEPVGIEVGTDLARADRGVEQPGADGHEPVEEVGMQGVEARVVGLQRGGEPMLGDQEIHEAADPLAQRVVRVAGREQGRAGLGESLYLVPIDSALVTVGWLDTRPTPFPMNPLTIFRYMSFEHTLNNVVVHRIAAFLAAGLRTGALRPIINKVFSLGVARGARVSVRRRSRAAVTAQMAMA